MVGVVRDGVGHHGVVHDGDGVAHGVAVRDEEVQSGEEVVRDVVDHDAVAHGGVVHGGEAHDGAAHDGEVARGDAVVAACGLKINNCNFITRLYQYLYVLQVSNIPVRVNNVS